MALGELGSHLTEVIPVSGTVRPKEKGLLMYKAHY